MSFELTRSGRCAYVVLLVVAVAPSGCIFVSVEPPIGDTRSTPNAVSSDSKQTPVNVPDAGGGADSSVPIQGAIQVFDASQGTTMEAHTGSTYPVGSQADGSAVEVARPCEASIHGCATRDAAIPPGDASDAAMVTDDVTSHNSRASTSGGTLDSGHGGSSSPTSCTPEESLRCGSDGNVHWVDSCGFEGEQWGNDCEGDCIEEGLSARCRCVVRLVEQHSPYPDGRSWEDAYWNLAEALDAAKQRGNCELWVSEGSYRGNNVSMLENVDMYGGFNTTMTLRAQRDPSAHLTVIDGGNESGTLAGADRAILDGFTLSNWRIEGIINDNVSPTIKNCSFDNVLVRNLNGASPVFEDSTFRNSNGDESTQGAIHNEDSAPVFRRCIFTDSNYILTEESSKSRFESCEFRAIRRADFDGSTIIETKFTDNFYGTGTPVLGADVYIVNSIFDGNQTGNNFSNEALYFSGVVANSLFINHQSSEPIVSIYGAGSIFVNNAFVDSTARSGEPGGGGTACVVAGDGTTVANTLFADLLVPALDVSSVGELTNSFLREGMCPTCSVGDPKMGAVEDSQFPAPRDPNAFDSGSQLFLPPDRADLDKDGDVDEPLPLDAVGRPRVVGGDVDMGPVEVE